MTAVPERLRQARHARGLSLEDLRGRLGGAITRAALSKYELGKSRPSADMLLRLARSLEVRPGFLLGEAAAPIRWLAYRKHARLTRRVADGIQARAALRVERQLWLEEALDARPARALPPTRTVRTLDDAEAAAAHLRRHWRLDGAIAPRLVERAEDEGARVVTDVPNGSFDGLSGWAAPRVPVIVLNAGTPADRTRLNLAHELGHLACEFPGASPKEEEILVFRFAAAFLVPADAARAELGERRTTLDLEELARLKLRWGVSMQAWIRRAHDLGIVGRSTYVDLNRCFRSRGWHRCEPVAYEESEKPQRLARMTLRALAEGVVGTDWARETCPEALDSVLPGANAVSPSPSPRDLLRLPRADRAARLAQAADSAAELYTAGSDLTATSVLDGDDFAD